MARDGKYNSSRQDGTVYSIFHDGTGRWNHFSQRFYRPAVTVNTAPGNDREYTALQNDGGFHNVYGGDRGHAEFPPKRAVALSPINYR